MESTIYLILRYLHLFFMALGLGGATIANLILARSEKDPELGSVSMKVTKLISRLIWVALIGLILTGPALSKFTTKTISQQFFSLKILLVLILLLNAIYLSFILTPRLQRLAPEPGKAPSLEFQRTKNLVKISGLISLVCWYLIVLFAILMLI
jgi:hypothetical protein